MHGMDMKYCDHTSQQDMCVVPEQIDVLLRWSYIIVGVLSI